MCLTLQRRLCLCSHLQLQSLDLHLLIPNLSLLIANLSLQRSGNGGLPLSLLRQCDCLVVLLYQDITGIVRVPD